MWLLFWWQRQSYPTNDSCPHGPGPEHPQQQSRVKKKKNIRLNCFCAHSCPIKFFIGTTNPQVTCDTLFQEKTHHPVINYYMKHNPGFYFISLPAICCLFILCRDLLPGQRAIAMISEMIHTASLVHDDVIDGSDKRRGKRTINEVWGERKVWELKPTETLTYIHKPPIQTFLFN